MYQPDPMPEPRAAAHAPAPAPPGHTLHALLARPAEVAALAAQMLLALGLGVALVLKVYMMVFTDQTCAADGTSLGNAVRCTPVLHMLSGTLALVAGLRLAAMLFAPGSARLFEVLLLAASGVLLGVLADLGVATAGWGPALLVGVLALCVAAAAAGVQLAGSHREK